MSLVLFISDKIMSMYNAFIHEYMRVVYCLHVILCNNQQKYKK